MYSLASDDSKNTVILVNDYFEEYGVALKKLAKYLDRPLAGILLIDITRKQTGKCLPDPSGNFKELACDFNDPFSVKKALRTLGDSVLLVTCGSERNQPYLKSILPYLPYVYGPTETSLDWSTHKYTMRKHLQSYNPELTPKYHLLETTNAGEINDVLKDLKYPLIVKPNGLSASILVTKISNRNELLETLKYTFDVINKIYSRDKGRGKPGVIIEEFIEGDIYSIDAYVNETGIIWPLPPIKVTTANSMGLNGFYGYQRDSAIDLNAAQISAAQDAASQAIHALGLKSTVTHIELFNTKKGWKIIELGARAGGYRQEMYKLAFGIDHAYNELLIKIGLEPIINNIPLAYCTAINIYADNEGIITAIEGYDGALRNPSVYKLKLHSKVGDRALSSGNGGKYIVDGILQNKNLIALNIDLASVRSGIVIKTKALS